MRVSQKGIDLIKRFESLHDGDLIQIGLQPKMCPAGIWTEGWGRAMTINGQFIRGANNRALAFSRATITTPEKAEKSLHEDLEVFGRRVLRSLTVKVSQAQFDALVSHTYNTGGSNTLFRLINRRAPAAEVRAWFETRYITGGGVRLEGLVRRRKAEADLFFSESYPAI